MARRHAFGTNITSGIDAASLREASKGVGTDLRYWASHGTVASVKKGGEDYDFGDMNAVLLSAEGVDVDVRLEPLDVPVTCRYSGISAGDVTIMTPIYPKDIVLVVMPDGDLITPVIVSILASRSRSMPVENEAPIFDNRRALVYAKAVPIDIRTAGGVRVLLEQDGTATVTAKKVKLGGSDAGHPVPQGDSQKAALNEFLGKLSAYATAIKSIADPSNTATPPLLDAIANLVAAQYLSPVSFTK